MRELNLSVPTPAGPMPVFAAMPRQGSRLPGVLVCMDVFGPREELYDIARRYATCGYLAVLPDLFHRLGSPRFEPADRKGDPVPPAAHTANDATTLVMSAQDALAVFRHGEGGGFGVQVGVWGVVGYCMGGRHAIAAAVHHPRYVRAALSVHGGRMVAPAGAAGESPHRLLQRCRVPLYIGCARDDPTCPPEHQALLEEEARGNAALVTVERVDALHGWSFPQRWCFDRDAANHVWDTSLSMFRSALWTPHEPLSRGVEETC